MHFVLCFSGACLREIQKLLINAVVYARTHGVQPPDAFLLSGKNLTQNSAPQHAGATCTSQTQCEHFCSDAGDCDCLFGYAVDDRNLYGCRRLGPVQVCM